MKVRSGLMTRKRGVAAVIVVAGALMPLLAPRFGVSGVVWGLVTGMTLFALLGSALEVWKYFRALPR